MPLTAKGQSLLAAFRKEYGSEKGERVFYASKASGKITGVDSDERIDMDAGTIANVQAAVDATLGKVNDLAARVGASAARIDVAGDKYATVKRDGCTYRATLTVRDGKKQYICVKGPGTELGKEIWLSAAERGDEDCRDDSVPNDYEAAKAARDRLEAAVKAASAKMQTLPKGAMGLTSDATKSTAEWKEAREAYNRAASALQKFNSEFVTRFAAERRR